MKIKHNVVIWSDINNQMLSALIDENDCLRVVIAIEKTNPADNEAVVVLLDIKELLKGFGGTPANLNASKGISASGYIRVGYLKRTAGKSKIYSYLCSKNEFLEHGILLRSEDGLQFESFDENSDIPF